MLPLPPPGAALAMVSEPMYQPLLATGIDRAHMPVPATLGCHNKRTMRSVR
jgi:hypothetical protein